MTCFPACTHFTKIPTDANCITHHVRAQTVPARCDKDILLQRDDAHIQDGVAVVWIDAPAAQCIYILDNCN
eukprot:4426061-Amphidinium_carterae.1